MSLLTRVADDIFYRLFFSVGHYSVLSALPCAMVDSAVCVRSCSRVQLFATPQTVAHQVPLSVEFSRQEYWDGLPFPPSGNLLDPGIEPMSLASPALADGFLALHHLGSSGSH